MSAALADLYAERQMHPEIARRALPTLEAGFHDEAIVNAFKAIEVRLREILGVVGQTGPELVTLAFRPGTGPLIDPEIAGAEQEAFHLLLRSSFQYFRNPPAHRFTDSPRDEAVDLIVFASRILTIIESANEQARARANGDLPPWPWRYGRKFEPLILDVDGDGEAEIISHSEEGMASIQVSKSVNGVLRVQDVEHLPAETTFGFFNDAIVADVDGDGADELICFYEGATKGHALLIYKHVNGRYEILRPDPNALPDALYMAPSFLHGSLRDVDGDKRLEVRSATYYPVPEDMIPDGYESEWEPRPYSGLIGHVWKWNHVARHFDLIDRSLVRMGYP